MGTAGSRFLITRFARRRNDKGPQGTEVPMSRNIGETWGTLATMMIMPI